MSKDQTISQPSMLTVEQLCSTVFRLYKKHFLMLFLVSLLCNLLQLGVSLTLRYINTPELVRFSRSLSEIMADMQGNYVFFNRIELILLVMIGAVGLFVVMRITHAIYVEGLSGRAALKRATDTSFWHLVNSLSVCCLLTVMVFAGMMLLILPGIIIYAFGILALPVAIIEGEGIRDAFRRSSYLSRGYAIKLCFFLLLFFGAMLAITLAVPHVAAQIGVALTKYVGPGLGDGLLLANTIYILRDLMWSALITPFGSMFLYLVYVNIRLAKGESISMSQLR